MRDSEMTVPTSQFAQMLKVKHPKFASVPDARLIEAFALRHPEYRVTYEGTTPVSISWKSPVVAPTQRKEQPREAATSPVTPTAAFPVTPTVSSMADTLDAAAKPRPARIAKSETSSFLSPETPRVASAEIVEQPILSETFPSPALSSASDPKSEPVSACLAYAQVLSLRREFPAPKTEFFPEPAPATQVETLPLVPPVAEPPLSTVPETKPCVCCGIILPVNSKFCLECGALQSTPAKETLNSDSPAQQATEEVQPSRPEFEVSVQQTPKVADPVPSIVEEMPPPSSTSGISVEASPAPPTYEQTEEPQNSEPVT